MTGRSFDREGAFARGGIGMMVNELKKSGLLGGPPDLALRRCIACRDQIAPRKS
jgi:hypothetical protein